MLVTVLLLSSKIWDDYHVRNADYCKLFEGLTLTRVNQLESTLLNILTFRLFVNVSEYSKYHFQIQDLITKSELQKLSSLDRSDHQSKRGRASPGIDLPNSCHKVRSKSMSPSMNKTMENNSNGFQRSMNPNDNDASVTIPDLTSPDGMNIPIKSPTLNKPQNDNGKTWWKKILGAFSIQKTKKHRIHTYHSEGSTPLQC